MQVRELMTRTPSACGPDATANDVARIMWERDCGVVPVVDNAGRPVGVVTDRDICMAAYLGGQPLKSIRVADVMSRDLCTIESNADLTDAEHLMQSHQIRRLPVVAADGRLVGILSLSDIAQGVMHNGSSHQDGRDGIELLCTVDRVSMPRGRTDTDQASTR